MLWIVISLLTWIIGIYLFRLLFNRISKKNWDFIKKAFEPYKEQLIDFYKSKGMIKGVEYPIVDIYQALLEFVLYIDDKKKYKLRYLLEEMFHAAWEGHAYGLELKSELLFID
ncbi:MAG: hypothetical protein FH756_10970 [Firmicutes bacterium]|nr:hypothetical protein [Bacillota bacterium]